MEVGTGPGGFGPNCSGSISPMAGDADGTIH